jgi:rRNA biogenesis protein RRP5
LLQALKKAASESLPIGSFVQCVLRKDGDESRRVLPVSRLREEVASAATKPSWALPLACLTPGTRVSCTVQAHLPDGVLVSFIGFFSGTIDLFHLPGPVASFPVSSSLDARVLFVSVERRLLVLSARPELLALSSASAQPLPAPGSTLEGGDVVCCHPLLGVVLRLEGGVVALCPKAELPDDKAPSAFEVGSRHRVRVLSTRAFDRSVVVSLRPSVLSAAVICSDDLEPGVVTKAVVSNVAAHALFLLIADRIPAMCPRVHARDVPPQNLQARFNKGETLDVRVLSVKDSKVRLTAKKTLLESELATVCDAASTDVGAIAHGTVSAVKEGRGVFVSFYGDAFGLVPVEELPPAASLGELYYVGQVLAVRVVGKNSGSTMLRLSLDLEFAAAADVSIACGDVLSAKIVGVGSDDGAEPVRVRLPGGCFGQLPLAHLADHAVLQSVVRSRLQGGDELSVLVARRVSPNTFLVSIKPSLLASMADGEPLALDVGRQLAGYVASVQKYGVIVAFADGRAGLVPCKELSEDFTGSPAEHFSVGDSLLVRVESLQGPGRIVLSAKALDIDAAFAFSSAATYFSAFDAADENDASDELAALRPGCVVDGTVSIVKKVGVCFDVEGLSAFAVPDHTAGAGLGVGDQLSLVVLDADRRRRILDVSARPSLLSRRAKAAAKGDKELQVGAELRARVELVKDGHVCLSGRGKLRSLPLFACTSTLGPLKRSRARELLAIGDEVGVVVLGTTASGRTVVSLDRDELISRNSSVHRFRPNSLVEVEVQSMLREEVRVSLVSDSSVSASIHLSNIVDDCEPGSKPQSQLQVGQRLQARVLAPPGSKLGSRRGSRLAQMSVRPSDVAGERREAPAFEPGDRIVAFLHSVVPTALWFSVVPGLQGVAVPPTDLSEALAHRIGEAFSARVVARSGARLDLELLRDRSESSYVTGRMAVCRCLGPKLTPACIVGRSSARRCRARS